jgi:hypothetical protein
MNNIHEWIFDNMGYIEEMVYPILQKKNEAMNSTDALFHDDILKQYKDTVLSAIAVEACKRLGCSVESFYESAEELDEVWKMMIC